MPKLNAPHDDWLKGGHPVMVGTMVVGKVVDSTFRKQAWSSKHMLKKPPAWAIAQANIPEAQRLGATEVIIKDRDTGDLYQATFDTIKRHGWAIERAGFEPQVVLNLNYWRINGKPSEYEVKQEEKRRKTTHTQLPMFAEV